MHKSLFSRIFFEFFLAEFPSGKAPLQLRLSSDFVNRSKKQQRTGELLHRVISRRHTAVGQLATSSIWPRKSKTASPIDVATKSCSCLLDLLSRAASFVLYDFYEFWSAGT